MSEALARDGVATAPARPQGRPAPLEGAWRNAGEAARPTIWFWYPPGLEAPDAHAIAHDLAHEHRPGPYVWPVRTWAWLREAGYDCRLTAELPSEGIVVTHRHWLPNRLRPGPRLLLVCIVADFYRHPFAQWHTLQNLRDPLLARRRSAWPATYLPLWRESGLLPRDAARGARFENVCYYGLAERLAPQLRSPAFAQRLAALGLRFRVVERHRWHDYSDTDAVLAVRSFAPLPFHKFPPSKLYNAWFAGVPALLGRESAYQAERRSELDYFEVSSADEVVATLERLRDDPALRLAVAANAARRAREIEPARMAERWIAFFEQQAVPAWREWCALSAGGRAAFFASRALRYAGFAGVDVVLRGQRFLRRKARALRP